MERKINFLIEDIIDSINKIQRYIKTVENFDDFSNNDMVLDAVTRNFEIIGEIANKLPQELKNKYSNIPWRQMYGLRNYAIHEYHIIDNRVLWEIANKNLPENKIQIQAILNDLKKD